MGRKARALIKVVGFISTALVTSSCACAQDNDSEAKSVLELTKSTKSTYSLYLWNHVTESGEPAVEEGSAEFHMGDFHRVETPRDRIVANCRTQTGYHFSIASGEINDGPQVAAAACGINTNSAVISIDLLPDVQTKFGTAQRVRVVDRNYVREYHVLKNGALVRTTYTENLPEGEQLILAEAIRMEPTVPNDDMFSRESLKQRYLPLEPQ